MNRTALLMLGLVAAGVLGRRRPTTFEIDPGSLSLPIYDGVPPGIVPNGWRLVDLAVTEDEQTYYEPRRFVSWGSWADKHAPGSEGWKREASMWFRRHVLAVVDDGALTFWLIARPAPGGCADEVVCSNDAASASGSKVTVTKRELKTDAGGLPWKHQARLGYPWQCEGSAMAECWDALVRPYTDHPLVKDAPMMRPVKFRI